MKILSIETSCDETAVSILEAKGGIDSSTFTVLGNALLSQASMHAEFGGVYPNLAKREHSKNLLPILKTVLKEAGFSKSKIKSQNARAQFENQKEIEQILTREPELLNQFTEFIPTIEKPDIDAIAVTYGPGLEPALWVGINFAKALSQVWNIPLIPIDHMEGHILSSLLKQHGEEFSISNIQFPALALLISGGHTQLVLMKNWFEYDVIGETRDDAVGEAFDKTARMLGLPYPGGPEISLLADRARSENMTPNISLPRPMLGSNDYDFSFSGLKTAVLYALKGKKLTPELKKGFALEFENAVVEVLATKTKRALDEYNIKTLVIGGGVSANYAIRRAFLNMVKNESPETKLYIPSPSLATDNAIMIGIAGYFRLLKKEDRQSGSIKAQGNLKLSPAI